MVVKIILTLLVSGVIGYATNFIAVKMLFRPLKPIYIGKMHIPFTPGIIPKGKPRLARALGNAVGDTLLTDEDIENALLSDKTCKAISDEICMKLYSDLETSIKQRISELCTEETYNEGRQKLCDFLSQKIYDKIVSLDIGRIVVEQAGSSIKERLSGGMLGMFINDDFIASISEPVADKINSYIITNGEKKISEITDNELAKLECQTLPQLLESMEISSDKIQEIVSSVYKKLITGRVSKLLSSVNLKKIVEDKVNSMEVEQVEELVLSVMKNELNAVVNLGAIIGLVIGIINVIINL